MLDRVDNMPWISRSTYLNIFCYIQIKHREANIFESRCISASLRLISCKFDDDKYESLNRFYVDFPAVFMRRTTRDWKRNPFHDNIKK